MLSSCAWPRFMLVRWVRVGETIGGKGLPAGPSLPNHLLHAKGGASDNHEGNFRWANGCSEWHHFVRFAFVSLKPNTFTQVSKWGVCNWDVCAGRRVKLLLVSIYPRLARYLIHETSRPFPSPTSPPPIFILITLCLREAQPCDILYSMHFWPTVLDNGFQILQGGLNMCQSWKWKANTSPSPSAPT